MDFEHLTGDCPICHHGSAFREELRMRIWPTRHFYGHGGTFSARPDAPVRVDLLLQSGIR